MPEPKMTTYISLLKGINVSGQKPVKMDALRKSFEQSGFKNVTTYVQSGNVVFSGREESTDELSIRIARKIEEDFGFQVAVIVLTNSHLKQIIAANPFSKDSKKDHVFLHVTFLSSKSKNFDSQAIEEKKLNGEDIHVAAHAVYLYCPNGYGKTKLTNSFLESKLKTGATTRNWKTTVALLEISQKLLKD
jgi:uncharacterized protein (DUF1697 family)